MENIKYRIASIDDIDKIMLFYNDIIDNQRYDEYTPMWTKDVYPCFDDISYHLKNNKIYIGENDIEIVSCLVFQIGEEDMYKDVNWVIKDDVGVIHLLAINSKYRRLGYGEDILNMAINDNKDKVKTIHLDVMLSNLSASKMYESFGFKYIDKKDVYYEDTGHIQAMLYEYII